jgi:hypothetical protein
MGAMYNEKCDKCGQERPEFFVQVNKLLALVQRHSSGVWNVLGGNHSKVASN